MNKKAESIKYKDKVESFLKFYDPDMQIHGINLKDTTQVIQYLNAIRGAMNDLIFNPLDYELLIFLEVYYCNKSEEVINIINNMKNQIYNNYYEKLQYYNRIGPNHTINKRSDEYLRSFPDALPRANSKVYAFYYMEMEGLKGQYKQTLEYTGKNTKLMKNNKEYTIDISEEKRKSKINENNTKNKE